MFECNKYEILLHSTRMVFICFQVMIYQRAQNGKCLVGVVGRHDGFGHINGGSKWKFTLPF